MIDYATKVVPGEISEGYKDLKKDETPNEKIEPKSDSEEGLLGGGMPDPSPA